MAEDAVGPERHDHVRLLLLEDARDRRHRVLERHVRDATVRQIQPLVAVGDATQGSPRRFPLDSTDLTERLAGGGEAVADVSLLAEGGVDQDEPEVRVLRVPRDTAGDAVPVVVRMREDAGECPVANDEQYRRPEGGMLRT
jgi:hypothetical protein